MYLFNKKNNKHLLKYLKTSTIKQNKDDNQIYHITKQKILIYINAIEKGYKSVL